MDVGFIGLGIMGASMASNLQTAGHALRVHDIRRQAAARHLAAGAAWKDTPRAVAEAADVVFLSLPGPAEVEAVALGADGLSCMRKVGALRPVHQLAPLIRRLHGASRTAGVTCWPLLAVGRSAPRRKSHLGGGDRAVRPPQAPCSMAEQHANSLSARAPCRWHNCTSASVKIAGDVQHGGRWHIPALWKLRVRAPPAAGRSTAGWTPPGTYDPRPSR